MERGCKISSRRAMCHESVRMSCKPGIGMEQDGEELDRIFLAIAL